MSDSKDWHCAPRRKTCQEKCIHKDLCRPLLVDMGTLFMKETTTYSGQVVARITGFSAHCLQIPCIHSSGDKLGELFVQKSRLPRQKERLDNSKGLKSCGSIIDQFIKSVSWASMLRDLENRRHDQHGVNTPFLQYTLFDLLHK